MLQVDIIWPYFNQVNKIIGQNSSWGLIECILINDIIDLGSIWSIFGKLLDPNPVINIPERVEIALNRFANTPSKRDTPGDWTDAIGMVRVYQNEINALLADRLNNKLTFSCRQW